jgi:hypothetical protein
VLLLCQKARRRNDQRPQLLGCNDGIHLLKQWSFTTELRGQIYGLSLIALIIWLLLVEALVLALLLVPCQVVVVGLVDILLEQPQSHQTLLTR